ncbi:MFS transporter [Pendulispora brunnea]|uniref:MFS transporter n=2 Tax=Pendulispora brunnea TaxID=2905690 RepID=A0ABZ2KP37_9BACT
MLGVFCVGTAEIVISGLLPEVSSDLGVSLPSAGQLVTAYALGVSVLGPLITLWTSRWPRKSLVIALMGVFLLGNVASMLAPGYRTLLLARLFTSLSHGTFTAEAFHSAAATAPQEKQASAMAKIALGFNLANALGAPLGTLLGQRVGWRFTFLAVVLGAAMTMFLLARLMPASPVAGGGSANLKNELRIFRRPSMHVVVLTTVLAQAAVFTASTYVVPLLRDVAHFEASAIPGLLILCGVGAVIGNFLGGHMADGNPRRGVIVTLGSLSVVLTTFWAASTTPLGAGCALFLFGLTGFSIIPSLQSRIQSISLEAPTLALSINVSAFNLGNGLGAWIGGQVIDLGWGLRFVLIMAAAVALFSLMLALGSSWKEALSNPHPSAQSLPE